MQIAVGNTFTGESDGILQVVEETQVRGTVEKTYALAFHISDSMETMLARFI